MTVIPGLVIVEAGLVTVTAGLVINRVVVTAWQVGYPYPPLTASKFTSSAVKGLGGSFGA